MHEFTSLLWLFMRLLACLSVSPSEALCLLVSTRLPVFVCMPQSAVSHLALRASRSQVTLLFLRLAASSSGLRIDDLNFPGGLTLPEFISVRLMRRHVREV